MKKTLKSLCLLLPIFLSLFLISCGKNNNSTKNSVTDENLKIHYIDVGQGDSELIQVNGKNILIDAGTSDKRSLEYLKSIGITRLDYVIATHPHEDHIGSMDDVIINYDIGDFYAPKVTTTTKTYENMINALKSKSLKINVPKVGEKINIGNLVLTFLAPNSSKYDDLNNYSIVIKLEYGKTSFVFMGDAEGVSENEILAKQLDIQADVLKVGHHGSHSSTTQAFIDKVNPKYAVISCEKGNDYGHPHKETIDKLNNKNIKVFRTDMQGTIIATSNGENITFNVEPVDKKINVPGNELNKASSK
ncbi:ComEC/Rec2 family competence protein [Clostridium beijerinckii]|uniref:ComEC/Rec2 family competence protein n=1 Tax=Clostridium beijerinckii TaxID=1520 RepID=UPI00047CDD57|nr:ComEC/Rec2 family competence protein [Clostridium beijerinckii]